MSEELLRLEDLSIDYKVRDGYLSAVNHVNCTINRGEVFAIVGESGCGKSTVAHSIMNLLPGGNEEITGKIIFKGQDLRTISEKELEKIRGKEIGMIFQNPLDSLNPVYRVGDQTAEAILLDNVTRKEAWNRVIKLFKDVKMPDAEERLKSFPHELSGGMRQRVMIAMMLSRYPELLIADEPTTALDVTVQAQIIKLLKRINKQDHTAILFISHDLGLVRQLCEKVIVLKDGDVVESGRSEEIFANPKAEYTKKLIAAEVLVKHEDDGKGEDSYLTDENEKNDHETNLPIVCEVKDYTYVYPKRRDLFSGKKNTKKSDEKSCSEKNLAGAELTDGEIGIYDINLTIRKGEILGLVGESGSGKSTIARNIAGLLSSKDGEIRVGKTGMVFQDSYSALNPKKRIKWLLREALRLRGVRDKEEQQRRITEIAHEVEMPEELLERYPSELSGGQRQRVVIAMALLGEPDLLIADEPVSALDVAIQESIMALLKKISTERGMAILFISHDLRTVYFMCHNVIVLKDGRIVESATKREIFEHPKAEYTKELLRSALGEEEI